ncbi:MAG TPA: hypothetical protein VFS00_07960, partial [Polyangiaceae bacterium]|nr:hypothetical protein [Polyangiaceae bacterium]
ALAHPGGGGARDELVGAVALSAAAHDALLAAAFPEGRASCARLPCDEPSGHADTTTVSKLESASAVRGAFTAPGRDQIAWALVARAEALPLAFALTMLVVTEGDTVVARSEPEALSHGTFALERALDTDGDGADELVTRTTTAWMGEGHVDAALVGVRAGRLVELRPFDDLLTEHTGLDAKGDADAATRVFFVPASAGAPAAFETESFSRGCRPAGAAAVRPTAKPCTGGATDWRRAGSTGKAPAVSAPPAGPSASLARPAPAAPAAGR